MAATPTPPGKPVVAQKSAGGPTSGPNTAQATQTAPALKVAPFKIGTAGRRERFLKLLVYGNYGTGKTWLAGSAVEVPDMRDVILINAEAGDLTLQEFDGIDEVSVKSFATLARVYEFLKAHCVARDAGDEEKLITYQKQTFHTEEIDRLRKYRTVIIDSLSEVEQYALNQLLGVMDSTRLDDDPMAAEWKEYKQNNTMMLRLVRNFRDLPMHVIFTCAEAYTQDETKKHKYTLDLTGKLSKKVQGFMDMVGYLVVAAGEDGKQARRLYVTPSASGRYDAKHRYTAFKGQYFDNPTIESILKQTGLASREGALLKSS